MAKIDEVSADRAVDHGGIFRHPLRFQRLRLGVGVEDVPDSKGCHSRHPRSARGCTACRHARVLPVDEPPTSTTIRLRPAAAPRTAWANTRSCSRRTYLGSRRTPGTSEPGTVLPCPAG
ncbi:MULTISPECIES: hypothetical protein [Streptomyces]|uniref:hypothetical protein n=1 Tax=Streptomyces TaxID=1883 RepID=UPI002B1DF7B8|nr:hypothetical protein [Streptomyces sp. NBC_00160]